VSGLALAVIAGWLVLLAVGFDAVLSSRVDQQLDDALLVRAQAASSTVVIADGRITGVRESATDGKLDSSIWVYRGATAIAGPNAGAVARRTADRLARSGATEAETQERRFFALPVRSGNRRIGTVVAALDTDPYEETKHIALVGSGVVAALLLVVAYPVLRLATSRALRPVEEMTRRAADWSLNAPGQRFGSDQRYAELQSLAGSLDQLLARVAGVLRHERQLSAELSHELRTPLTRLVGEIDLMLDNAPPTLRTGLEAMRASCTAMDGIIDTLLTTARTELVPTVGHTRVEPVLRTFAATAVGVSPAVRVEPTELSVGVDEQVIARTLSPVIDNACRYAASEVSLSAARSGSAITISVSNDGPPLAPDLADRVFEPGYSHDDRRRHNGAGLGLSLARRLARAADGDVTLVTDAGPTTFLVTLPAG
jgi:signal transduction histidine kinase